MVDFLQRLKQRKLVQWMLAYLAAAWVLLQVLDLAAGSYHWPDTVMHIAFAVLALGFVVALVLAWYHGERGAQRVTGAELLLIALVLAVGGGLLWHFGRIGSSRTATRGAATTGASPPAVGASGSGPLVAAPSTAAASPLMAGPIAAQPIPAKSVAVLPFENLSADKGNAYFADGMQDLILTKLADIGDLKVISRTSTQKYKSHPEDLKTIAQQLGVATILEGSVQKAGNQVLINVQLIDAKTDNHLWAESYTRTLDNIFGVEGEVAEKIATALNAKLTPTESAAIAKAPTHNKQALDDYLRGRYYVNHNVGTEDPDELKRGIALLEQATRLDPGFTDAFSDLSLAYQHLGGHDKQAEAAARRALALNPGDANAHRMVAYILMEHGKFEEALLQAQEAVRLAPQSALINNGLGNIYNAAGQVDKAAVWYRHALELDPRQNIIRINLGLTLAALRRYADATETLRMATMADPSSIRAATSLAWVQELGDENLASARETLQAVVTPVSSSGALSDAWYWLDLYARDYSAALAAIRQAPASWFQQQDYPLALYEGQAYRAQGNEAQAKQAFAQAWTTLEAGIKSAPQDTPVLANLSLALAGLGNGKDAVAEAQRAIKFAGVRSSNQLLLELAVVEAWSGKTDAALKLLDELLDKPAGDVISANLLKTDPTWDPIRRDPRFQALLKKYGDATPASADSAATVAGGAQQG
jgi:serine/threonine-protein kinase